MEETMRWFLLAVGLAGCGGGGTCTEFYKTYCDACPSEDDLTCKCLDDGKLTVDEAGGKQFESDDDAQRYCDELQIYLSDAGPESQANCKAGIDILDEIGNDACDDVVNFGFH